MGKAGQGWKTKANKKYSRWTEDHIQRFSGFGNVKEDLEKKSFNKVFKGPFEGLIFREDTLINFDV